MNPPGLAVRAWRSEATKRIALLAALAVLIALPRSAGASPSPDPPPPPAPPCLRMGETVAAVDPDVAVLRRGARLVGCLRDNGRRRVLFDPPLPPPNEVTGAFKVRVSGSMVAFVVSEFCTVCDDTPYEALRIVDLEGGTVQRVRRLHDALPVGTGARVLALGINPCGFVAYLTVPSDGFGTRFDDRRQLRLLSPSPTNLLDRGPIRARSVQVNQEGVRWRRGSASHFYRFGEEPHGEACPTAV